MFSKGKWSGITGHQFEEEFVGSCKVRWTGEYIPFRPSVDMVRKGQPTDAVHELGKSFLTEVAKALNVTEAELTLLTAVGTPLDQFHRIDAIIEYRGMVAYVDFKMRNLISRVAFVVRPEDVDNGFSLIAQDIAWFFRRKASEGGSAFA